MHSDTNGWLLTRGQNHPSSVLARTTVEWKVLIGSFDYPTLLTLRHRHDLRFTAAAPWIPQSGPICLEPRGKLSIWSLQSMKTDIAALKSCSLTAFISDLEWICHSLRFFRLPRRLQTHTCWVFEEKSYNIVLRCVSQGGGGAEKAAQQEEAAARQQEMKNAMLAQLLDQQARARRTCRTWQQRTHAIFSPVWCTSQLLPLPARDDEFMYACSYLGECHPKTAEDTFAKWQKKICFFQWIPLPLPNRKRPRW